MAVLGTKKSEPGIGLSNKVQTTAQTRLGGEGKFGFEPSKVKKPLLETSRKPPLETRGKPPLETAFSHQMRETIRTQSRELCHSVFAKN